MSIAVKFGGSSLADAGQFRKVAHILQENSERRFVVVSAPGKRFSGDRKMTDLLYQYSAAGEGKVLEEIRQRFQEICRDLGLTLDLEPEFQHMAQAQRRGGCRDFLASRGEYLNGRILAAYLKLPFLDPAEAIFFREDGELDEERTYETLGQRLRQLERAVIPGFYGALPDGTIHTFSRGGSDITGALVARAVKAVLYENWTDVPGVLMADPAIVPHPRVIPEITYRELRELACMGASVLHDEAVFPVREARIPINIRDTNAPKEPGTMILSERTKQAEQEITGIAGKTGFSVITVEKDKLNGCTSFGRKILEALEACGIAPEHVPNGVDTVSILVSTKALENRKKALTARILRETGADTVTIEDGIALLSIVGHEMSHMAGIAGRVMTLLAQERIDLRLMEQCFQKSSMILGIREEDYPRTMQAVYDAFAN